MVRWGRDDHKNCPVCETRFEKTYGTAQEYCSVACKQKAYRQRIKALRLSEDKKRYVAPGGK